MQHVVRDAKIHTHRHTHICIMRDTFGVINAGTADLQSHNKYVDTTQNRPEP